MHQLYNMSLLETVSLLSAVFFTAAICWQDYRSLRIPNRLVYSFALVSVYLAIWRSVEPGGTNTAESWTLFHWPTFADSVLGFLVAFAFTFFFWNRGWMGAGDVKLASALGLCVGIQHVVQILLLTHLLAFVIHRVIDLADRAGWRRKLGGALLEHERQISMGPFYATSLLFVLW